MSHFLELRLQLADRRTALRHAKDYHDLAKAEGEQHAIDTGKAGGSNAEQRQRSLTIALDADDTYTSALAHLRQAEHECERVEALLEAARDERRASEWQIRAQLAAAIMGTDIPSNGSDPYGDDAFESTLDAAIDRRTADPFDHAMHAA